MINFRTKPKAQKHNIVVQELENETLIYDLKRDKALCLNQTSAMIWQSCNGIKTITEIAESVGKNLKTPVSEDLVRLAINDLQKEHLIEVEEHRQPLEGKSRRELIRKIGLSSMVAIPVISSLVAPRAVDAQSGCGTNGQTCTFANFTQSTCCPDFRCFSGSTCLACREPNNNFDIRDYGSPVSSATCQSYCNNNPRGNWCCNQPYSPAVAVVLGDTQCFCRCP